MVENQIRRITVKNLWKFVKTSGIYFIGTVLHKLITFFLLPIYTKYIDKADLGTYDLATAYINFLCSILFLDIWSGIMRFAFEYEGEEQEKADYQWNCDFHRFYGTLYHRVIWSRMYL